MNLPMQRRAFLFSAAALGMAAAGSGASASRGGACGSSASAVPVPAVYDLVVAGGSTTGVAAAVTAARAGLTVALVEYNAFFGGTATSALVPVWHSLYSTDGKTKIIGGLTEEIENRLLARGEAELRDRDNPSVGCYFNVAALQLVLDELVAEQPTITTYFKAQVVAAEKDREGHLTAAVIEDKSGRRALRAKWFIDATGDADLTARAGFETWKFPKGEMQTHTLCALFANVGSIYDTYKTFVVNDILKPEFGAGLKHVFGWWAPVVGAGDLYFYAGTRVSACDPSVAEDLTEGLFEARRQIRKIVDAVNRKYPMPPGKRFALVSLGSDLGLRESRHIKARYRVTAEDVLYGHHFDDCIAKGSYRVDIHEGEGITFRYLDGHEEILSAEGGKVRMRKAQWRKDAGPRPTWYEIPFRALVPEKAENLICAGRMIDCTREAFGALRVMVNCNQMGEAAARHVVGQIKKGVASTIRPPSVTFMGLVRIFT